MSPSELDPGRPILSGWREHSESSQSALRYRTGRTKALDPEMTTAPHGNSGSLSWTLGVTSVDTRGHSRGHLGYPYRPAPTEPDPPLQVQGFPGRSFK